MDTETPISVCYPTEDTGIAAEIRSLIDSGELEIAAYYWTIYNSLRPKTPVDSKKTVTAVPWDGTDGER